MSAVDVGSVLDSRFRLIERLGSGAFGTVWIAHDAETESQVAVKVLHEALADRENIVQRFRTEVEIISRLDHPNVARAIAAGGDGDDRWFAMELVEGKTLKRELEELARAGGAASFDLLIEVASGIASALDEAHGKGIVHRDLKGSNVILVRRGSRVQPKVVDFGIAKIARPVDDQTTQGRRLGTLMYMSPEQLRGEAVDHRTDIFSFGVLLFEMLTLRRPFVLDHGEPMRLDADEVPAHENSSFEVMKRIAADDRPLPSKFREGLGKRVDEVILRALDHFRDNRFPTAQSLLDALFEALDDGSTMKRPRPAADEPFDRSRSGALRRMGPSPLAEAPVEVTRDTAIDRRPEPPRARISIPALALLSAVVLIVAAMWVSREEPIVVPIAEAPTVRARALERPVVEQVDVEEPALEPPRIEVSKRPRPPVAKLPSKARARDPGVVRLLDALERSPSEPRVVSEVATALEREAERIEDRAVRVSIQRCATMSAVRGERAELSKCVERFERALEP